MASNSADNGYEDEGEEKNYISYTRLIENLGRKRKKHSTLNDQQSTVIWFKNDLRLLDNPALYYASKLCGSESSRLIGLFVFCSKELKVHGYADCKIVLLLRAVRELQRSLKSRLNAELFVVEIDDPLDVPLRVVQFCVQVNASNVCFNKQYEIDEKRRDEIVRGELETRYSIRVREYDDQCVVPPGTCKTGQGRDYVVFTPYKRTWLKLLESERNSTSSNSDENSESSASDRRASYLKIYDLDELGYQNPSDGEPIRTSSSEMSHDRMEQVTEELLAECESVFSEKNGWLHEEEAILEAADRFIQHRADDYHVTRDYPSVADGTSRLSPYLALGMISAKYLVAKCRSVNDGRLSTGRPGLVVWINEICWRDFYRNILSQYPYVCMNQPFKRETRAIEWSDDREAFEKWCRGRTGFPIVDAAMHQLNETGWMHNRLRMVVAMFLCKDLLINWRWGEKYFASRLIDGDFASNNGGWQWSASTGTDAQPYFRVFNPLLQSKKFDKDGRFIREWVPELRGLRSSSAVHDPFGCLEEGEFENLHYPRPMVDHGEAKEKAIAAFKKIYGKK